MALIEVTDLYNHFGDVKAVDGILFAVEECAIFGFLGPNGAGMPNVMRSRRRTRSSRSSA